MHEPGQSCRQASFARHPTQFECLTQLIVSWSRQASDKLIDGKWTLFLVNHLKLNSWASESMLPNHTATELPQVFSVWGMGNGHVITPFLASLSGFVFGATSKEPRASLINL